MPARVPARHLATRALVSLVVAAGLAAAFVAGTSYGGQGGAPPAHPSHRLPGGASGAGGPHGTGLDATPAAYRGSGLTLPDSCGQLLQWYVERGLDVVGPYGWAGDGGPYAFGGIENGAGPAPLAAAGPADQAARSPLAPAPVRSSNGETGTNVQEAGVDEPDVVKTDGHTLYRVQDDALVVYDLGGATVRRLGSLALPGASGADSTELLLSGDSLIALSQHDRDDARAELVSLDVSEPAAPKVTHTVEYDGTLVTARLTDGVVRVVLSAGLPHLDFTQPDADTTPFEATRANQDAVRDSTIADWLPHASVDGGAAEPLLGCDQVALPGDDVALGTMAVVGFDASAPDAPSVTGLAADTDLVYASADQLYLATHPYDGLVRGCFECLDPLPVPDARGPLPGRLTAPGGGGTGPTPQAVSDGASHLYAFDLDGIETTLAASGEVDGVITDRWSMDAVDGVLRVVVAPDQNTGNFSSVVTFRQEGNDLVESGRLDDLGVGEQVRSVRWFDTLAIVVTFRQVDPMYAVDLTDPDQPRLMGTLTIPGYSAYLHPLGRHRLLGLGQTTDPRGRWGAQAGLFNVTDLTHPRGLATVAYGPGTQALATTDPRQLTWLPGGRTVLTVVEEDGRRGEVGYVSELQLGDGKLSNRMVEVEYGDEVAAVRLVPLADGRVVLVTGDDASFFDL